jgi:hypothetical protein
MYDTGSTGLVLPDRGCTTCGNDNLFDPARSTSFSTLPDAGVYTLLDYSTAASSVPVVAGNDSANCTYVTDAITLHGLKSPEQTFALCNLYPSSFENVPVDGILGLGISPQASADNSTTPSFWSWYNSGLLPEPVFSFDLIPGSEMGAELTLGGIDHSKYTGEIAYINLDQNTTSESQLYIVDLTTLFVDDKEVLVTGNYSSSNSSGSGCQAPAPSEPGVAALDTGTAFLQAPDKQTVAEIYAQIAPEITEIDPNGAWGAPCAVLDAVAPELLTFSINNGTGSYFNLTLTRNFFNLGEYPGQPGICQAVFNHPIIPIADPLGEGRPVWILGSPLLKEYYTVWDGLNLNVGFAKSVHQW